MAGAAIINSDDAFAHFWHSLAKPRHVVDFGLDMKAAVSARYELAATGSLVTIVTPKSQFVATLNAPGLHNVKNALAAATAAYALGIESKAIVAGIAAYRGMKGRLQRERLPSGATLIDDTYNANPESMKAAIAVLAAHTGRKVFVMGDMGELGDTAGAMHAAIGMFAKRAGVERLFALGELSAEAVRGFGDGGAHFATIEDLVATITGVLGPNTTLLIKGSRFMRMERVVEALGAVNGEQTAKGSA
jgi:UDP-N-acetylmuramoyl-tripeptide--D-alanyl-D-alanine ligase